MPRTFVHGMVHRALVTGSGQDEIDAVAVDEEILLAADIRGAERITLTEVDQGRQIETYALPAERGKGEVVTHGAAAALAGPGSRVVLTSYASLTEAEASVHTPRIVLLGAGNTIWGPGGPVPDRTNATESLVPRVPPPWSLAVATGTAAEAGQLSRWMTAPHIAHAWGRSWPPEAWRAEIRRQLRQGNSWPCFVSLAQRTLGYIEIYRASEDPVSRYYDARDGDVGIHIALANPEDRGQGHGPDLLRTVSDALLSQGPAGRRVIAEPNASNLGALRAFTKAGFTMRERLTLPQKTAALMVKDAR